MAACSAQGILNDTDYTSPLPWIGLYVASASTACAIAMASDLIHACRNRNFWFPTKLFSINATSLTVTTVAVKLSVDLNTPMPSRVDQLSKLSSGVLVCVAIANSMPSLGTVKNKEIMMNMIAFGILVVTVFVNVAVQLGTGVIYVCRREHVVVVMLMVVMLMILVGSGLAVAKMKTELEVKYRKRYEIALREGTTKDMSMRTPEELKDDLRKFWMMAHTSDPQFVMGRSVTCTASGALCLLGVVVLAEAMIRSFLTSHFCVGESDYKWSTGLVLVSQTVAIVVGTVAPAIRWIRFPGGVGRHFKVEKYWIQCLVEIKECPPFLLIKRRHLRRLAHRVNRRMMDLCIRAQIAIVTGCKLIQFVSITCISRKLKKLLSSNDSISERNKIDLSRFVLHLEGEEDLVEVTMRKSCNATDHWMQRGAKRRPKHLTDLLRKATFDEGFKGVREFDCNQVPSLESEEPPQCWSLPIVTLTAIAVALPDVEIRSVKHLLHSVHEGLMYVKLIEDNEEDRKQYLTTKARRAAYRVWSSVDIYHKWFDIDLLHTKGTREILQDLAEAGNNMFADCRKKNTRPTWCPKDYPIKWNAKGIAANSMYRISSTILLNRYNDADSGERLFRAVEVMISDLLAACLTNLRPVIFCKCLKSTIEERKVKVREAVYLLGETEEIVKLLDQSSMSIVYPDKITNIDDWLSLQIQEMHV
ncbi:hypothetical protein LINPERPRIM_LOCUS36063 [Linum perenne]